MYLFNEKFKNPRWRNKLQNNAVLFDIFLRLEEIYINSFEWIGLPETVDERYLELGLCERGHMLYFNDDVIGNVVLPAALYGEFDIYTIPTYRRAFAVNGYQANRTGDDSVIIYNNFLHQPAFYTIMNYAKIIYEIEMAIRINVKAQKTPILIGCDESQLFTLKQAYNDYEGNMPVIFKVKNLDLENMVKVLTTNAPYVAQDLQTLKKQYWNEYFSFCGIMNSSSEKKERQVADEVSMSAGGIIAQRNVAINARKEAARKINKMFGTNIEVKSRNQSILEIDTEGEINGYLYNNNSRTVTDELPVES